MVEDNCLSCPFKHMTGCWVFGSTKHLISTVLDRAHILNNNNYLDTCKRYDSPSSVACRWSVCSQPLGSCPNIVVYRQSGNLLLLYIKPIYAFHQALKIIHHDIDNGSCRALKVG